RAVLEARRGARRALAPDRRRLLGQKEALALGPFRDSASDRFVNRLRDPGRVETMLAQDIGRLALGQELVGQREVAHPPRQAVRRESLEHSASEAARADVV